MGTNIAQLSIFILFVFLVGPWGALYQCSAISHKKDVANNSATLYVDTSPNTRKRMPDKLFGVFFEEINHAGTGGLWAELVSNRGFEATDRNGTSTLDPWGVIGDESMVKISTDLSSPFPRNRKALRMEVLCDECPEFGVGVFNPGYWGMNIVKGKYYSVTLYVRSLGSVDLDVSLAQKEGLHSLSRYQIDLDNATTWNRIQFKFSSEVSDPYGILTLTTTKKGVLWLDQVSVMPLDTHQGHGFRWDLFNMVQNLSAGFMRFPGGTYVEGIDPSNRLDWKETVGPWENRPGHYNDAWNYWTDDAMGHYEYFILAEDLQALPIWVFSIDISVEDALEGIEFALGDEQSTWGSVRAAMGHPKPFDLRYVSPGNEDCGKPQYDANYRLFFDAIRKAYPDIQIITNCDYTDGPGKNPLPADIYDYHTYPQQAIDMYNQYTHFDKSPRDGPKAFVSEYAVWGKAPGNGNLVAALAESAFLMGLEKNSDVVEFASYAPLFVNTNDKTWIPDAIVFDSYRSYGTPSYWMQTFFRASNGATYLNSSLVADPSDYSITASAISWRDWTRKNAQFLRVKVVNYGDSAVNFKVVIGSQAAGLQGCRVIVMGSGDLLQENSFEQPMKVVPRSYYAGKQTELQLLPHTLTAVDIPQRL